MENDTPRRMPNVPPFVKFVCANVPMVFDDSLSYYEALCALWKYVQGMTDVINNNATLEEEFIEKFNILSGKFDELKNYVDTYFDNLDVQEEINNKLDQMVESGEMSDLIAQYIGLGALVVYDTLAELISSVNVSNGCKVKTLGKDSKGDGFGAYYTIGESGDIELDNGLYATLVPNFGGNNYYSYFDDITTVTERHNNTTCYITTIPYLDHNSKTIEPYIAQCSESPLRYAQKNKTSFTMNASLGKHTLIHDGEVLVDRDSGNSELPDSAQYLAITEDRNLIAFKANTATYANMIAGGAKEAWLVFYQIIINSVKPDWNDIDSDWSSEGSNVATSRHPRQCIGVKADKTIIVLTTDGRRPSEWGLTSDECADILLELGCVNAWNLDGGGSTSTSINGYKLNANIDNGYTADREAIDACLNIKLPTIDEELGKVNSYIGKAINENNAKLVTLINSNIVQTDSGDANDLFDNQNLKYVTLETNTPAQSGYIWTIPISNNNLAGTYGKQIFYERDHGRIYTRSLVNNVYKNWCPSDGYKSYIYDRSSNYQTITADNTYEQYTFTNSYTEHYNINSPRFVTVNNDNTLSFTGDCQEVLVTLMFDLENNATAGKRYVKAISGNNDIAESICQWYEDAAGTQTHSLTFVANASDKLKFMFYAKAGDKIGRLKVYARSLK